MQRAASGCRFIARPDANVTTAADQAPADHQNLVQLLFVRHAAELRGFILALQPDFSRVDDIFQEVFLTVTRKAASYDPERSFLPWACGIARYKVLEDARQRPQRPQPLSDEALDALCASEPAPVGEDDRLKAALQCLERLAPHARQAFEMRYTRGHKPPEIARHLNWSLNSVYVILSRTRAELRACVELRLASCVSLDS